MSKALITTFYKSFQERNADSMASCYHEEVTFQDPAFGVLHGKEVTAMWQMLCKRGNDLVISYGDIQVTDDQGSAHWEATYTFRTTGRKVHNVIEAEFKFKDGLIIKHTDHFNLHDWASQAIGWKGWLLGGTGFFKRGLQKQTRKVLDQWIAAQIE